MRSRFLLLPLLLALPALAKDRVEQNEPPVITHYPPGVAYAGSPVPIYAEVTDKTGKLKKVSLFYALSQQNVPVEVPMKKVRGDRYSGLIPANFFSGMSKVWYFVSAVDSFDDKQDTSWYPVLIKRPDAEKSQPDQPAAEGAPAQAGSAASAGSSGRPVPPKAKLITSASAPGGIGAGTVITGLVVAGGAGAAVALSDSGGGDGDGGGGGFDPANAIAVTANGNGSGGFASGPQDRTVDGSGVVGGRTITGVRVTVNYQAYTLQDQFQIVYQGRVLADSGLRSGSGTIVGTGGGSSPLVTIRVLTPSGGTLWNWNAKVEYSAR
jgi:hypothetical protein